MLQRCMYTLGRQEVQQQGAGGVLGQRPLVVLQHASGAAGVILAPVCTNVG